MIEANKKSHQIMKRILQVMSVQYKVWGEPYSLQPPVLMNSEDWKDIEKDGYNDRAVVVDVATPAKMTEENFRSISKILQDIETYPSKNYI